VGRIDVLPSLEETGLATGANEQARLGVDIGGTFTDVALETGGQLFSAKVLTTPEAPERAVIAAIRTVLTDAGLKPGDPSIVIHGTTLATNALIERKGAKTALVTTEGFRDTIEIRHENRFEQYDVNIDLPPPLVPRRWRFVVPERLDARGRVVTPLDEGAVAALAEPLATAGIESVAIGFLHSFMNPAHEERTRDILAAGLRGVTFTLSCEVSPEMREYERFSTACANAYVQPMMGRYLANLEALLRAEGLVCPLFLMLSGGGLTTVETAIRFPVRLVESGPAGGAIFASHLARQCGLDKVLSYDMGGTTAKICLIDDFQPQSSRAFEVARIYRFKKGSGLPLRIPVIEMVEIGAGGGSIARVDRLRRITVGPDSAGADPGPACYGRGGTLPSVTDADLLLGCIDPAGFSGGRLALDFAAAEGAVQREIAAPLGLALPLASFGVGEIVDENMANAARVHAIESGKDARGRTLVAFGGAAPLHAARLADKLGLDRVLVPKNAGVGSAVGFLRAPIAYEIVRSQLQRLDAFDADAANTLFAAMRAGAEAIVRRGPERDPLGLHALSRPGPRDRRTAARTVLPLRGCGRADDGIRSRLPPTVQPGHSRRRGRGVELGAAARGAGPTAGRRHAARAAAVASVAGPPPRRVRRRQRRFRRGRDLRALGTGARRRDPWPGDHRRGRNLDRRQPPIRRSHRPLRLY
jgi:N-methylhydantoinase A